MSNSQNTSRRPQTKKRKRRKKRKRSVGGVILRLILIVMIVAGFAVGGAVLGAVMGIVGSTNALNTEDVVPESYTSFIYDSNGNEIDKLHGKENREYAKLDIIPMHLQKAVIAIEDERFYEHNGVDMRGIARAVVTNVKNRSFSQGASTITQQLIKNEVLTSEKKLQRKIKEQYLALGFEKSLEKQFGSKEKAKKYILELYLNSIGLNHGLNGVQAASKYYFGKTVDELDLAECASLAGITKNPSLYSPISHPDKNKERQMTVLGKMKKLGFITEKQYYEAAKEDIYANLVGNGKEDNTTLASHSYFVDALIVQIAEDLMEQKKMSKSQAYNMIYSGGLKINATIDSNIQKTMEESYKNPALFPPKGNTLDVSYTLSVMDNETEEQTHHTKTTTVTSESQVDAFVESVKAEFLNNTNTLVLDKLIVTESLQSSMVIMDYHNGEVKALVGGRGDKHGDLVFNRATQALRQPGSCFKPLASYAPAIDMGLVMPGSVIIDEPYSVGGWSPKNWNNTYKGPCTVREGIRDSMNILAVKTIMQVGVEKSFEYLENFGFSSLVDREERNGKIQTDKGPATALGGLTDGVSVLELTAAYSTIANGGVYNAPHFYTTIYDHKGNLLLKNEDTPKRVLKATTAYMLTDMMKDVITGGGSATGRLANFRGYKMNIAGKTGTTNDNKDLMFAGYTPYYCAGIWLGYDNPKSITYDKSYHLLLWRDVMEKIHAGMKNKVFERPEGIVTRSYCSASGCVPSELCGKDYYGNGISSDLSAADFGSTTKVCDYHKSFRVDLSTGKLANEYCPKEHVADVILAVDPSTGVIVNKPSKLANGKVDININETCTVHNSETKVKDDEHEINSEIPIGGEYPGTSSNEVPPIGAGNSEAAEPQPPVEDTNNGDTDEGLFIPD